MVITLIHRHQSVYIGKPRWPWYYHVLFGIILYHVFHVIHNFPLHFTVCLPLYSDIYRSQQVYLYFLHLFLRHFLSRTKFWRYHLLLIQSLIFSDLLVMSTVVVIILWSRSPDEPTQCYILKMITFTFINIWAQKKFSLIFFTKVNQVSQLKHLFIKSRNTILITQSIKLEA